MVPFVNIRSLISEDRIDAAIEEIGKHVDENYSNSEIQNRLTLITNQQRNYQHREKLNLPLDRTEKNEIVYGLLQLLSEIQGFLDSEVESIPKPISNVPYEIKDFISNNKKPIATSGAIIVIVLSLNSTIVGVVTGIFLILIFIVWIKLFE